MYKYSNVYVLYFGVICTLIGSFCTANGQQAWAHNTFSMIHIGILNRSHLKILSKPKSQFNFSQFCRFSPAIFSIFFLDFIEVFWLVALQYLKKYPDPFKDIFSSRKWFRTRSWIRLCPGLIDIQNQHMFSNFGGNYLLVLNVVIVQQQHKIRQT